MTLLEANLRALTQHQGEVGRRLESLVPGPGRGVWAPSRGGSPTVRREGRSLASTFDPVQEAGRAVPDWDGDMDFILVPSLGAGYLAEAVARRYPDHPLVIAEADPGWFLEVLSHRDLTALWSRPGVVVLLGPDPQVVGSFFDTVACPRVETLAWRPLVEQEPQWHQALADQVAWAQARGRVNLATAARFGALWRRNWVRNEAQARAVRPVKALRGHWAGSPAVVAAAGPSLAEAFAWLERYRDRFVLIAVDTAWPALAARGLEPDVLMVLDGQYWNARHVDRDPPPQTLVVTEWTGPPRAFRLAPGRTYVAATSVPFLRVRERARWGDLGALPTGGSVATAAWSLALLFGCTEVAFAGLDLGYPRGQTHVPGSQFEEAIHRRSDRLTPAETRGLALRGGEDRTLRPGLDGSTVASDHRMDLFRGWLSASVLAQPEVRSVNLGTRGTLIPGLSPAPPDYGASWPLVPPRDRVPGGELVPQDLDGSQPPFEALRRVLGAQDFPRAVEEAWSLARNFWGTEVWDRWAGRARAAWDRFPSARSRRAVEEAVIGALAWEDLGKPEKNGKSRSRIADVGRS